MAFIVAQVSLGHHQDGFLMQVIDIDHCNMVSTIWLPSDMGLNKQKQKN